MVAFFISEFFVSSSFNRSCIFFFKKMSARFQAIKILNQNCLKTNKNWLFYSIITITNDLHGKFVDALALWQLINNSVLSFSNASSFFRSLALPFSEFSFPNFFSNHWESSKSRRILASESQQVYFCPVLSLHKSRWCLVGRTHVLQACWQNFRSARFARTFFLLIYKKDNNENPIFNQNISFSNYQWSPIQIILWVNSVFFLVKFFLAWLITEKTIFLIKWYY